MKKLTVLSVFFFIFISTSVAYASDISAWENEYESLWAAQSIIEGLDPELLKNRKMQKQLDNKVEALLRTLKRSDYNQAWEKLEIDMIEKTDGCYKTGSPQSNDWLSDCNDQNRLLEAFNATSSFIADEMTWENILSKYICENAEAKDVLLVFNQEQVLPYVVPFECVDELTSRNYAAQTVLAKVQRPTLIVDGNMLFGDKVVYSYMDPSQLDRDGDGYAVLDGDQDDADPFAYPHAPEVCDGFDNDFNGLVDEACDYGPYPLGGGDTLYIRPKAIESISLNSGLSFDVAKDELHLTVLPGISQSEVIQLLEFLDSLDCEVIGHSTELRLLQIRVPENTDEVSLIDIIKSHPLVATVDFNSVLYSLVSNVEVDKRIEDVFMGYEGSWIDNIKAREAWVQTTGPKPGSKNIKIGIIDRVLNSGAVDWERVTKINKYGDETTKINANVSHGTYVTAFAAGDGLNERLNTIGVAWANDIIFCDINEIIRTEGDLKIALKTVADKGAKVINLSQGPEIASTGKELCSDPQKVADCQERMQKFRENMTSALEHASDRDALVVFASGNAALEENQLFTDGSKENPVRWDTNAIIVGATGNYNDDPPSTRASYSHYGSVVDIAAPGGDFGMTKISPGTAYTDAGDEGSWPVVKGTSYAAPIVSGVAALLKSENPELSAVAIKDIIVTTANKSESLSEKITHEMGGLINAEEAVRSALESKSSELPDLMVEDFYTSKTTIVFGAEPFETLSFTVKNIGDSIPITSDPIDACWTQIARYRNGLRERDIRAGSPCANLPPGYRSEFTVDIWTRRSIYTGWRPGSYTLRATVDPDNDVKEKNENNNSTQSISFEIICAPGDTFCTSLQ